MHQESSASRPDPLEPYFAEYLRTIDSGAGVNQLRETQQRLRRQLAEQYRGDQEQLVSLDAKLRQFFDDHTNLNEVADAVRVLPDATIGLPPSAPNEHDSESIGEIIGNYEIVKLLGRGGMGVVHQARHRQHGTWTVAIKRLLQDEPNLRARFHREIQALAALKHQNIIAIYDFGEYQRRPYFVMEYAEGGSLADYLRNLGLPDWSQPQPKEIDLARQRGILLTEKLRSLIELMVMLGSAMAHAHSRGVLHRDLKPGNVLLQTEPGQNPHLRSPRIADLGLAKLMDEDAGPALTRDAALGTPYYAAPEQIDRAADVKPHADIYSLGAILYELLTGEPPFRAEYGENPSEIKVAAIKHKEPPPPHLIDSRVPLDLSAICAKCLRPEPGLRFESAQEFVDDLQRWLDGKPIRTRHQSTIERLRSFYRREPMKAWLRTVSVAAIGMVIAAVVGWSIVVVQAARRDVEIAEQKHKEERDHAERRNRTAEEARKATNQAKQFKLEAGNFPHDMAKLQQAVMAAREAEIIIQAGEADEKLRAEVRAVVREIEREIADVRLLASINDARLHKLHLLIVPGREQAERTWIDDSGQLVNKPANKTFLAAFRDYGIDLEKQKNAAIIDELKTRSPRIRGEAALALTELGLLEGGLAAIKNPLGPSPLRDPKAAKWVRYFVIAQEIDEDPWRKKLRRTLLETNPAFLGTALDQLHRQALRMELPVSNLCFLAEIWGAVSQPRWGMDLLNPAEQREPNNALVCCYLAFLETRRTSPVWADVANWYRAAVALQPNSPILRYSLGNAYYQGGKREFALTQFRTATDLDPKFSLAWYNQGAILQELHRWPAAANAYRQVLQLGDRFPEVLTNLGGILGKTGDTAGAINLLDESLKLNPRISITYHHRGIAKVLSGDVAGGIADYRSALKLKEAYSEAHLNLGDVLQAQGDLVEALKHLQRARALMPDDDSVAKRAEHCRRMLEFDGKLALLVKGTLTPTDALDCIAAAQVAALRKSHITATRLYGEALTKIEPTIENRFRVLAARSALAAAAGQKPADAERTRLRKLALRWLREELTAAAEWIKLGNPMQAEAGKDALRKLQSDMNFAGVRDPQSLAALSGEERAEWAMLWADIQAKLAAP